MWSLVFLGLLDGSYYNATIVSSEFGALCRFAMYAEIVGMERWWNCGGSSSSSSMDFCGRRVEEDLMSWSAQSSLRTDGLFAVLVVVCQVWAWRKERQ